MGWKHALIAVVILAVLATVAAIMLRDRGNTSCAMPARASFRMPIEDVFSLKIPGSIVVAGVVAEGEVRVGDSLYVLGGSERTEVKVQAMETYRAGEDRSVRLERAAKGERVGIMLAGASKDQITNGHVLIGQTSL